MGGSPLYMAPEVMDGSEMSVKSDIWSLGILFFQLLYGKTPWTGESRIELMNNINTKELVFPEHPKRSATVKNLIKKMLEKRTESRYTFFELFQVDFINDISNVKDITTSMDESKIMEDSLNIVDKFLAQSADIEQAKGEQLIEDFEKLRVNVKIDNYEMKQSKIEFVKQEILESLELKESMSFSQKKEEKRLEEIKKKNIALISDLIWHERNIALFFLEITQRFMRGCSQNSFSFPNNLTVKILFCLLEFSRMRMERTFDMASGELSQSFPKDKWKDYYESEEMKINISKLEAEFEDLKKEMDLLRKQIERDFGKINDHVAKQNIMERSKILQFGEGNKQDDEFLETFCQCLDGFFRAVHFNIFELTEIECQNLMSFDALLAIKYLQILKDNPFNVNKFFKTEVEGKIFDFLQFYEENRQFSKVELILEIKKVPWKILKKSSSSTSSLSGNSGTKSKIKERKVIWG